VRASEGTLSVSYLPKDAAVAPAIPEVLGQLSGVKGLTCSMAATNILWVQECFGPSCPTSEPLARIAQRWNAAVEILRVVPATGMEGVKADVAAAAPAPTGIHRAENGGIEDDRPPATSAEGCDDAGLRAVYDELTAQGLAGGMRTAECSPRHISLAIDHTVPYSLVVVGDVFTAKGHAASQRLTRELCAQLGDILRVPVIRADELKSQYFVTGWQLTKLALFGLTVGATFWLVFTHQRQVLRLLSPEGSAASMLAAGALLVFVPLFAYLYGSLAKSLLKLAKIE